MHHCWFEAGRGHMKGNVDNMQRARKWERQPNKCKELDSDNNVTELVSKFSNPPSKNLHSQHIDFDLMRP